MNLAVRWTQTDSYRIESALVSEAITQLQHAAHRDV
jgi:hypothetical protein